MKKDNVAHHIRKIPKWKSPIPDGIQGFWLKRSTNIRQGINQCLDGYLAIPKVPTWFVEGRTTLFIKNKSKDPVVVNYCPIAYSNLIWKFLTSIISESTYNYVRVNKLLPFKQKVCWKSNQGTKDHLSINKAVLRNCKRRCDAQIYVWFG